MAAGLLTAALAVAAHGAAGGAPTGAAVVLLALLAATIGGLAVTIARTADVRLLLALLVAGQLVSHVMLSLAGHSHGAAASPPTAAMLVAHGVAVGVGAILIAAGDRLCRAVSRTVEVAVRTVAAPIPVTPAVVTTDADQPLRSALLLAASVSHRGPPVGCAR